jgi:hypothetical protein
MLDDKRRVNDQHWFSTPCIHVSKDCSIGYIYMHDDADLAAKNLVASCVCTTHRLLSNCETSGAQNGMSFNCALHCWTVYTIWPANETVTPKLSLFIQFASHVKLQNRHTCIITERWQIAVYEVSTRLSWAVVTSETFPSCGPNYNNNACNRANA